MPNFVVHDAECSALPFETLRVEGQRIAIERGLVRWPSRGLAAVDGGYAELRITERIFSSLVHEQAGANLAGLYSLVATCAANDVEPLEYLRNVLMRVHTHPASRIDELLPHRWTRQTGPVD